MSKTNGNGKGNGKPKKVQIGTLKKAKRDLFLKLLAETANVVHSAEAAGLSRATVYRHKKTDEEFATEWEDALERGICDLEVELRRRALAGVEQPVYQGGEKVGAIQKYSDTLGMFLLKAHRPEVYRENVNVNMRHTGAVELRFAGMSREQAKDEVVNRLQGLLTDD